MQQRIVVVERDPRSAVELGRPLPLVQFARDLRRWRSDRQATGVDDVPGSKMFAIGETWLDAIAVSRSRTSCWQGGRMAGGEQTHEALCPCYRIELASGWLDRRPRQRGTPDIRAVRRERPERNRRPM